MLGKLVPCGGGAPIPLNKTTVLLGRTSDCDITVPCKTVSSRHCELQFRDGAWSVRDLDSKNGIAVNGIRCTQQQLAPNDTLAIGKQRYTVAYVLQAPSPSGDSSGKKPAAATADPVVEALALAFLTSDEEPAPAAPLPPPAPGPQVSTPQVQSRAELGQLVPCGGGDTIPLLRRELIVGRHPKCDIYLAFAAISAKHCKLSWQDGWWFVEDLKSSNGTSINGQRCQKKCLLPESVLGLAKHRFTIHYKPTGAAPPPEDEDVFAQSLLEKAGLAKQFSGPSARGQDEDDRKERIRYRLDADDT